MIATTIRPGLLVLATLLLLIFFFMELALSSLAEARPYPRHDHVGLSEDKRQYPYTRKDDYEDYFPRRAYRRDHYLEYIHPSLSTLDKTPEGSISLERVTTTRSHYTDNLAPEKDKKYGKNYYDQRANKGHDVIDGGKGYY